MREILFRGKRIDNGEWVYGFYGHKPNWNEVEEHFIMEWCFNAASDSIYTYFRDVPVIPETVGQYTGLDDKNGKRVFEGDVLNHPIQGKRKVYYPFSERVASYGLRMIDGEVRMASTLSEGFLYEIIGNIHDNQEVTE